MPNFATPIQLNGLEVQNAAFQNLGQAPATPSNGQFYWDTAANKPLIWNQAANAGAGVWEDLLGAAGTVTSVGGTAPIVSSGGSNPVISITEATTTVAGSMSATDKTKLDGIEAGATANATDADLRDRSTHTGTQAITTVEGLQTALDDTEKTANKDVANGYAGLDGTGKIAANALPALAISDTFVVASEAAQVALTAEVGDVAIRTDENQSYILRVAPASTFANWEILRSPTDGVAGVTGAAPITSTGGTTPEIGLANLGVLSAHLANGAVGYNKINAAALGAGLTGGWDGSAGAALAIDTTVVTRKFSSNLAAAASQVLTHNLNTRDVQVAIRETAAPYAQVFCDVEMTTDNTVTIRFATAPAADAYRATVIG